MRNTTIKGFLYAALSSSTFGLAPFFSISLLIAGFSSFEVLTYRWGIASLILAIAGIILGEQFRISRKDWQTVFILSLFRATTSFSLVIAYQNIASGVASTIHFMYPLAVAVTMMLFSRKKVFLYPVCSVHFIDRCNTAINRRDRFRRRRYYNRAGRCRHFHILLRRIYYRRTKKSRCQHPVYGTDLLCYGIRNPVLYYRRMPDRWDPAGHRQSHMAEHPRTGNTGNSSLQYQSGKGYQTCRPHAYINLRSTGTSDCHSHRMLRVQRKLHMEQHYRNRLDCDSSNNRYHARKQHGQSTQVILLRPLIIRNEPLHHPLGQCLTIGADHETALVESILYIAQLHKTEAGAAFSNT